MKLLAVDDDPIFLEALLSILDQEHHTITTAEDGRQAWELYKGSTFDAILCDWDMPRMDGLELCRRIRCVPRERYPYLLLITTRSGRLNYLEAMEAGADDFIEKPIDADLLMARIRVAERMLTLRSEVRQLEGLLSICCYCKRMKEDSGHWVRLEQFISRRTEASFSHCICEACYESRVVPMLAEMDDERTT